MIALSGVRPDGFMDDLNQFLELIARHWCRAFHTRVMWPIHGHYQCSQCQRIHPVCWEPGGRLDQTTRMEQRGWREFIVRSLTIRADSQV
jgi:hypothetical protein